MRTNKMIAILGSMIIVAFSVIVSIVLITNTDRGGESTANSILTLEDLEPGIYNIVVHDEENRAADELHSDAPYVRHIFVIQFSSPLYGERDYSKDYPHLFVYINEDDIINYTSVTDRAHTTWTFAEWMLWVDALYEIESIFGLEAAAESRFKSYQHAILFVVDEVDGKKQVEIRFFSR